MSRTSDMIEAMNTFDADNLIRWIYQLKTNDLFAPMINVLNDETFPDNLVLGVTPDAYKIVLALINKIDNYMNATYHMFRLNIDLEWNEKAGRYLIYYQKFPDSRYNHV